MFTLMMIESSTKACSESRALASNPGGTVSSRASVGVAIFASVCGCAACAYYRESHRVR